LSLKDDLAAVTPSFTGKYGCMTGSWLGTIDPDDRATIEARVEAGHNRSQLFRICENWGLLSGVSQFHKHWRRDCACNR
jgi:hypothetical protein